MFDNQLAMKHFYVILMILFIVSCDNDDENKNFTWFVNGKRFYYDLQTDTGFFENNRYIEIIDKKFVEKILNPSMTGNSYFKLTNNTLEVKKEGLFGTACKECDFFSVLPCSNKFDYTILPLSPVINMKLPEIMCGENVIRNKTIITINQKVTLANRTYNCTIIYDDWGYNEFWDINIGLIKYEILKNDSIITTLTLNKIE